jgi:hypothetical protein
MKRAQHIAMVLAIAPFLYLLEKFLQGLNGVTSQPDDTFGKFVWDMLWTELEDHQGGKSIPNSTG